MQGVHKAYLKPGDPNKTGEACARSYQRWYNFGEVLYRSGDGWAEFEMTGYDMPPKAHVYVWLGWYARWIELAGGKNVESRVTQEASAPGQWVIVRVQWT